MGCGEFRDGNELMWIEWCLSIQKPISDDYKTDVFFLLGLAVVLKIEMG